MMISLAVFAWELSASMPPLRRHASVTYFNAWPFRAAEFPTLLVPLLQSFILQAFIWEMLVLTEDAFRHTSFVKG